MSWLKVAVDYGIIGLLVLGDLGVILFLNLSSHRHSIVS